MSVLSQELLLTQPPNPTVLVHRSVTVEGHEAEYTAEIPEERVYNGFFEFRPGFGGFKRTSRDLRNAMAQAGFITITSETIRSGGSLINPQACHAATAEAIAEDFRSSLDVRRSVPASSRLELNRMVTLTHSMGGLSVPDGAEAVINLAPAGYGSPKLHELAASVPRGLEYTMKHELWPLATEQESMISPLNVLRLMKYFANVRSAAEAISCLTNDVRPEISRRRDTEGLKVGTLAFACDWIIPPESLDGSVMDILDVMPEAGHFAPQVKPQDVVGHVKHMAEQLELVT
jgi:hypothetical protein